MGKCITWKSMVALGTFALVANHGRAQDDFVRLQGRQFTLNGEAFYPMVMNYGLELCGTDSGSLDTATFFLSAEGGYDRDVNSFFECHNQAECDTQLLRHFAKVKEMGFNAIRAVGSFGAVNRRNDQGDRFYTVNVRLTNDWGPTYLAELDFPTFTGPVAMKVFSLVRHLLDLCDSADLKVILVAGGRVARMPPGGDVPWLTYDTADAQAYTPFLSRLAAELAGHPALMAYDLWNEPRWGEDGTHTLNKQTVCEWTTMWYDAIHAHSAHHLVTLGGAPLAELRSWDPMAMKLDFYSPHMYPEPEPYGNYDLNIANERFKAWAQWQTRVTPMPWIVGETGFSADDDTTDHAGNPDYVCLLPGEMFHRMPWMGGSEDDQVHFAFESMDAVRSSGGSGYSWWDFQSKRNSPVLYNDTLRKPYEVSSNWLAILGYSNGTSSWRVKKLADTIATYQLPPAPAELPAKRWNYGEWLQDTLTESALFKYGWIKDWQGRPIENALIEVGWKYLTRPGADSLIYPTEDVWSHYTTEDAGYFQARYPPHDGLGHYLGWSYQGLLGSTVSVPGGSGGADVGSWPPGQTRLFHRVSLQLTDTVTTELIGPWQHIRDSAFCDLLIGDQLVQGYGTYGGSVDYCARYTVHVPGEFHVQPGARAHLYTKPVHIDNCAWIPWHASIPHLGSAAADAGRIKELHPATLELKFHQPDRALHVQPNPASDQVVVLCRPQGGTLTILDASGRLIQTTRIAASRTTLNVSTYLNGQYTVSYTTATWSTSASLVVQH